MSKFLKTEAVVIKRFNFGDADRFVTLFSKEYGKLSVLAKGVRRIKSSKRATLEPLNQIKVSLYETRSQLLLTESQLIQSFPTLKDSYTRLTQSYQVLEILDTLTVENESHQEIYGDIIDLFHRLEIDGQKKQRIVQSIQFMLDQLGFGQPQINSEQALKEHIEAVSEKRLKVKDYFYGV